MSQPKFDPKEPFSKLRFGGRARRDPPYIVVRLTRELEPYDDGERYEQERLRNWKELNALWVAIQGRAPKARLRPLFRSLSPVALKRLVAAARCGCGGEAYRPAPFFAYFQIAGDRTSDLKGQLAMLRGSPRVVANAYIERVGPPPGVNYPPPNNGEPGIGVQFYLKPAPSEKDWFGGIDAIYAWSANGGSGGDGAGVRIIDVERGWFRGHPDFPDPPPRLLLNENVRASAEHGTSVLGILCAQDRDDGQGGIGIVPHTTSIDCVSYVESLKPGCDGADPNPASAIAFAASQLGAGDVMLLEATLYERESDQNPPPPPPADAELTVPLEANEANRAAIALVTALGITVVQAGGNGTDPKDGSGFGDPPLHMDRWVTPLTRHLPPHQQLKPLYADPQNPAWSDCGAIMVSAALVSSAGPPTRMTWAPRGLRVDCFAQAQGVYTTTCVAPGEPPGDCSTTGYTGDYTAFGGTSAATAIVAGAVAAIQGLALAKFHAPFAPAAVRAMLRDTNCNTPVVDENDLVTPVGVMPNLRGILQTYLGL